MSDLINRYDAVDELESSKEFLMRILDDMDIVGQDRKKYSWGVELIESCIDDIKELSSAEPEIIKCKDCKHRGEKPIADGRYWCDIHNTFMYYCSDAERRTDD